jgi:hypothetical protein
MKGQLQEGLLGIMILELRIQEGVAGRRLLQMELPQGVTTGISW